MDILKNDVRKVFEGSPHMFEYSVTWDPAVGISEDTHQYAPLLSLVYKQNNQIIIVNLLN